MDKLLSQQAKFQNFSKQDCSFVLMVDVLPKALGEIYLWSKILCFVGCCHAKISQTMAFHAVLLVSFESFWWIGVHQLALRLFGVRRWKLFIIQPLNHLCDLTIKLSHHELNITDIHWNSCHDVSFLPSCHEFRWISIVGKWMDVGVRSIPVLKRKKTWKDLTTVSHLK